MATSATAAANGRRKPPKLVACFSFAAYAKGLIGHLRACGIEVVEGLSDVELASVESTLGFSFPPDLRSILREGLPVGPGFPHWRSSSLQQLRILTSLPVLSLLKRVSSRTFWCPSSWGIRPDDPTRALDVARRFLSKAPLLVPIYGSCYIPSSPCAAGNPILLVDSDCVRVLSCDVAGFFQDFEFLHAGAGQRPPTVNAPAWAAKTARKIDFWTEAAEAIGGGGWWWRCGGELGGCLEGAFWALREGGWKEEDVREMMMDGCDDGSGTSRSVETRGVIVDRESMVWHVRVMSSILLRAGWSRDDVVYSLDLHATGDEIGIHGGGERTTLSSLPRSVRSFQINGCDHKCRSTNQLIHFSRPDFSLCGAP